MSTVLKVYQRLLKQYPYGSQAVQTAILMAAGDSIAQLAVERKELNQYNFVRTAKFASFGLFLAGPALHVWYRVLDKYIKSTGAKGALMKTSADQLLFAPCFLTIFVSSMGVLNGENLDQIKGRLDRDFATILVTNWKVWPGVQLVNFYFVPLQFRVLVAQTVAVFWNTFLAFVTNKSA